MNGPPLRRKYGVVTASALVVANMVGAGIFTTSGMIVGQLPDPKWVVLCWLLGGVIATAGALSYAELATRMPRAGGEYLYLREIYHPALGFLSGWTSLFVGFSVPIALSAMGLAAHLVTALQRRTDAVEAGRLVVYQKTAAILLIASFTALHYVGGRIGPRIQNLLTALKILLIAGLATAGMLAGDGSWSNFSISAQEPFDPLAFGTAMMMVMYSYSGWNASAYIAGELQDPRKTIPVSLIGGTMLVMLLYLLTNVLYFYAAPYPELQGQITVAEVALSHAFGSAMSDVLGAVIGFALLSSLSALIMMGPRVYYAMACDGLFLDFASKIHPRFEVPSRAILVQGVIATTMVMLGSFERLLIYVGFALGIFPWLAVYGLFRARRLGIGDDSAVRVASFVPVFFLATSLFLMVVALVDRPVESVAALFTVAAGVPFYYGWVRLYGRPSGMPGSSARR
jgi:APA family basic amino acid/polyamine antiporter